MSSKRDDAPEDRARRRLLKLAVYVPPAVLGAMTLELSACQTASCAPQSCQPATCAPADCNPGQCPPLICSPNTPCEPDGGPPATGCNPDQPCNPGR